MNFILDVIAAHFTVSFQEVRNLLVNSTERKIYDLQKEVSVEATISADLGLQYSLYKKDPEKLDVYERSKDQLPSIPG